MEEGDDDLLHMRKHFCEMSLKKYKASYARLSLHLDVYYGESEVNPGNIQEVEATLKEKTILETDGGSQIIDFRKHGARKLDVAIVRNPQGTFLFPRNRTANSSSCSRRSS